MALIPKLRQEELDEFGDITYNLPSLQFESALTDEEINLLYLRKRSHALTVSTCGQSTYFASIFNEARQIQKHVQLPDGKKASRLLQEASDPLLIGIIGCGRIGSHIAHCLLTFGEFSPQDLKISTRRPETLTDLSEKGVMCCYNNKEVASSVHLLFLCILPSQLQNVAEEIKGYIPSKCIVYSLTSAMTLPRVMQLLEHKQVVLPQHEWVDSNANTAKWDYTLEVTGAFADDRMIEQTCPVSFQKEGAVITSSEKFYLQMVFALVNYLTSVGLTKMEVTDVINAVIIGHSNQSPKEHSLESDDIFHDDSSELKKFPEISLATVATRELFLGSVMMENMALRQCIVDKYCGLFQHYLEWKKQALQLTKKQLSLAGEKS